MNHVSLAAVVALFLALLSSPSDASAQAGCNWSLLRAAGRSFAQSGFNPPLTGCVNVAPGPITNGCPPPIHNVNKQHCTISGWSGNWEFIDNSSCFNGPMRVQGVVRWLPNTYFTYRYRCTCSEGVSGCVWY